MDKHDVLLDLLNSKDFIYEVQGNYYYIGYDFIDTCTEEEIRNYKDLLEELNNMKETLKTEKWEKNDIIIEASKKLEEKYNKILPSTQRKTNTDKKIEIRDYIRGLPNKEKQYILKQREQYSEILDYLDGAFYRHDPKNKED